MRKSKALRVLAALLTVLMLVGGFGVISSADASTEGDESFKQIGGLTDVLSTIKYEEYSRRCESLPVYANREALYKDPVTGETVGVKVVDIVNDLRSEYTSTLCDGEYIANVICKRENLEKFFTADARINSTSLNLVDSLSSLTEFTASNPTITSISLDGTYTEYAKFLQNPDQYVANHRGDVTNPYKDPVLTDGQKADLVILTNTINFAKDITRKPYVVYSDANPLPDGYRDTLNDATYKNNNAVYLPNHDAVGWIVEIPENGDGFYTINIRYYSIYEEGVSKRCSIERSIYIDGEIPFYEATYVSFPKQYVSYVTSRDGSERYDNLPYDSDFQVDINGNEIRPETELDPSWRNASVQDSTGTYVTPLKFYFSAGTHSIQLYAQREAMIISEITLDPVEVTPLDKENDTGGLPKYAEYLAMHSDASYITQEEIEGMAKSHNEELAGVYKNNWEAQSMKGKNNDYLKNKTPTVTSYIKLEAEYPVATSDATVYPTNDRTSCITSPQHPSKQYLNTLGGSGSGDQKKWSTVGQWVRYKVHVDKSGFYKIGTRFSQTTLDGSFVSRILRVQLAGEKEATVPFAEAYRLQFDYSDDWQTAFLNDGVTEFCIYLKEGDNFIELEANLGDMSDILRRVTESLNNINAAYIKFLMLAGSTPDADRNYGFYRRIPDAVITLSAEAKAIREIAADIVARTGHKGSHVVTLEKVAQLLEKMGRDESKIAGNLNNLKSNLGTLGTWISDSRESPLELDFLMIAAGEAPEKTLPKATPNFFQTMWFEVKMFIASFGTDYNTLGMTEKTNKSAIVVWTTTGRDQANIIRSMINNDFTKKYNVPVNLKLVAGGSLLPSVLAGVGPDVSMGHGSSDMINWAIRSALVELTDMKMTEELAAKYDLNYEEVKDAFDAKLITGFDNVVATFHGETEDATVAGNAWFSSAAVLPMTLHEVITSKSYEEMKTKDEKNGTTRSNAYEPYGIQYYKDFPADYYENEVDKYEKSKYTPVKITEGSREITRYRYYISEKDYQALDAAEKSEYTKDEVRYYEKFSLWGLPQEQSFNMLFYRADIFNELGITPPTTWDDLYAVIGVLQSNNMEIAMPTSLGGFEMFLYQKGGNLYSNGGQTISFDEDLSIDSFEMLCQFFQSYKFPIAYDFSNRFRSGEIPMGILAYTAYTQLSVFATEIKGMWEFVKLPGIYDEQTEKINNNSTSGSSGLIMLKGARDRKTMGEAWMYMAWFTSASAQSNYASEVTAVLGTESKHPSANRKALYELPWTSAERDNLASQFDNLVGIPEYPGGYIISRYVNFAFLDVYNNNADPVNAILKYVVTINEELTRKRQEFGLANSDDSSS